MIKNLFPVRTLHKHYRLSTIIVRTTHSTNKIEHQMKCVKKDPLDDKSKCYKIIQNKKSQLLDNINNYSLAKSNIQLNDIELHLNDENKLTFNLTWLRDSCHCELCTHKPSRQRHFTPKKFKLQSFDIQDALLIQQSEYTDKHYNGPKVSKFLVESDFLSVNWSDGHHSLYSLEWLKYFDSLNNSIEQQIKPLSKSIQLNQVYDDFYATTFNNMVEQKHWTSSLIKSQLEPVLYEDLIDGFQGNGESTFINSNRIEDMSAKRFQAMSSLSRQLVVFGLAKIVNVPREENQVLTIANSLAYACPTGYGTVFNVVVEKSDEKNLAYSSAEFDLHVDLAYREKSPGVQLLHCIKNSQEGGSSYFSDAFQAAEILKQEDEILFDALVQYPITFSVKDPYRRIKFRHLKTVLSLDNDKKLYEVYYSPWALPPVGNRNDIKLFYVALDRFTSILHSEKCKYVTKMDDGDLFIFHNRRVLHGRSAYESFAGSRFLQGCYMDWDEILGLHEKLNSSKDSC